MSESLDNKIGKEIRRWRTFRRWGVFVGIFMLMLAMFIMAGTLRADRMRSVTIRTDVPVEIKMEDLKRVEPDNTKLDEIFTELEFKSFANRVLNKPKKVQTKPTGELDLFGAQPADGKEESKNASFETLKTTSHCKQSSDTRSVVTSAF